jgi:EmrB/QacA subfamily drug resistance transporter
MNNKKINIIFVIILSASILGTFLQTAMSVTLPAIIKDLGITASTAQWITSGSFLAVGVMTPATAYLLKRFSTKKLFVVSMLLLTLGLGLNSFSLNFPMLMLGRVIQSIGTGVIVAMTQVFIFTVYPENKRGTMMGVYGLAIGGAPIIAPTLAGVIVDGLSWYYVFRITFVVAIAILIVGAFFFEDLLPTIKETFDVVSMMMCSFGLVGLLLGVGNFISYPFISFNVAFPLGIGLVSMSLFIMRQLNAKKPFLDLRLFQNREFSLGVMCTMLLYAGMLGAAVIIPLYIQTVRGMSAMASGLVTLPGSILMMIINPMAGKIYDKFGIRKVFVSGSIVMVFGCIGLSLLTSQTPVSFLVLVFAFRQVAIGCMLMPISTWTLSTIRKQSTADGTAIATTLRTISGSVGTAVFVSLMSAVAASNTMMAGVKVSFSAVTIVAIIQLFIAVIFVGNKKNKTIVYV